MKLSNSFVLSLTGLACLLLLGIVKSLDVSIPIVSVVAAYVGSRQALKGAGILAASRDVACDTQRAIDSLKD